MLASLDRTAEQLEDLASLLDAGLPYAEARAGESTVSALRRALSLRDWEWAALAAGQTAGALPNVLRRLAASRHDQAALRRLLFGSLAYPTLVLASCALVALLIVATGAAPRGWIVLSAILLVTGGAVAGFFAVRLRDPLFAGERWWVLGRLTKCAGEIPYLVALHALYGAGVPLRTAHPEASAAAAVPWVRARLFRATADLEAGESLAAALARHAALTPESLALVRDGERTGRLEDALTRAITRRREDYSLRLRRWARALGNAAYVYAGGSVLWIALHFYGGLYGLR